MTGTTTGTYDWMRIPKSRTYKLFAGSTTSTPMLEELPDFPSLSMVDPGRAERIAPLILWVYLHAYQELLESHEFKLQPPWTERLQQQIEPDFRIWRGVFSPLYHPIRLFSQEIEVRIADLPRWKLRIRIDYRRLARGEDE
jgi:hypothetical protein